MSTRFLVAGMAAVIVAGCANDPAPTEQMKLTEQAIAQAKAVGAEGEELPQMQQAEEGYAAARAELLKQSYKNARMQAERAELDARLAEAQTLTLKSEEQRAQLEARLERLRKQLKEAQ